MFNQCTFVGNLGRDPEIKQFQNGDKIANFSIACTEKWKDRQSGERREHTEWVNVVVGGGLVNVVEQYLHKGDRVLVQGKLRTRKWQGSDGQDRYSTEVRVDQLQMLSTRQEGQQRPQQQQQRPQQQQQDSWGGQSANWNDDIPF